MCASTHKILPDNAYSPTTRISPQNSIQEFADIRVAGNASAVRTGKKQSVNGDLVRK